MKELLNHYKCTSKQEVYNILLALYKKGYNLSASAAFRWMDTDEQDAFINTMDPYDPAYTFFSTMGFAETV